MINLRNEWGSHNLTANAYASAYNNAIGVVRQVYNGSIIIDIPGWGQETKTAKDAVLGTFGTKLADPNIVLSTHVYPMSWNQGNNHFLSISDLAELNSTGKPCIVGEFGSKGDGGANWSLLIDYARGLDWTVIAWCWNGDGGDMNMVQPPWKTNATATAFSTSEYFYEVYPKL